MDKSKTRGYAFIEYQSHRAAALARRKLVPGNTKGKKMQKFNLLFSDKFRETKNCLYISSKIGQMFMSNWKFTINYQLLWLIYFLSSDL